MKTHFPRILVFCLMAFLLSIQPIDDGRKLLAKTWFDEAKAAYQRQETFKCLRYALEAHQASPGSAAPWILAGHCFYLSRQDAEALDCYNRALAINPGAQGLPPFIEMLRRKTSHAALKFTARERNLLSRKLGQRLMVSVLGTELTGRRKWMIRAGNVGGVILFGQNIEDKSQIRDFIQTLQASSPIPLLIAVDQEGGAVRRLREEHGFRVLPSQAALGEKGDPDVAYRFGRIAARQLKEVGANMNLAPVVDLNRGAEDSIINKYRRSLGSDPQKVALLASRIVAGMRKEGILATAKHFPSQSRVEQDTHLGPAFSDATLAELENEDFVPYRRLIAEGLDAVMLSHVSYPKLDPYFPASLSHEIVDGLLRGELGFRGVVVCDDLRMGAIKKQFPLEVSVVQAVNAGADLLVVTDNMEGRVLDILLDAAADGRISEREIDESYDRIMALKGKYGLVKPNSPTVAAGKPRNARPERPIPRP